MDVELLAPGGSYDSTIAALNAGADAVYTGGELFGARAGADNLTKEELIDVINYAHIHGKKIYLTVNTLLKDEEMEQKLFAYISPLYENGLDAVIVQDIGVVAFIRMNFPKLHIHASTQMTIFGKRTVQELEKMGVSRIVTPRELSLKEIKDIRDNSDVEIESFVHGALCYCYSGQCFLSSYIGGRSGNRGRCAQPCRMEYDIIKESKVLNKGDSKYILSPKDICTLRILPQIIEAGVCSLKIEGRMKKLEYISGVVSIYRKYLDLYQKSLESNVSYQVDERDIELLYDLFNRNGFSESYYAQHNGRDMISLEKPKFRTENEQFTSYLKENYSGKKLKREIDITVLCRKGKPFTIFAEVDSQQIEVSGDIPTEAMKRPIDEEGIKKQLNKTGNTDFLFRNITIDLEDDVFLPLGAVNDTRRKFIEKLYDTILSEYQRDIAVQKEVLERKEQFGNGTKIHVSVSTMEQLNEVIQACFVDKVYIEMQDFSNKDLQGAVSKAVNASKKVVISLSYVFRKEDVDYFEKNYRKTFEEFNDKVSGILIRNIEQYFYLRECGITNHYIFDYNVYTYNKYAKYLYDCFENVQTTVPVELNYYELKKRECSNEEFIVYGYMPVMISAGCALKTTGHCNGKNSVYEIKDKKNNVFLTKNVCTYCYNAMYNCKPLSLFKFHNEIEELNVSSVRISLTFENKEKTREILAKTENAFVKKLPVFEDDKSTRGHFKRGVL